MSNEDLPAPPPPPKGSSTMWDVVTIGVMAACGLLGLVGFLTKAKPTEILPDPDSPLQTFGIALGGVVFPGLAVLFSLAVLAIGVMGWMGRKHNADGNFSSFPPPEEKTFVVFEHMMLGNAKRAAVIGVAVAAVLFLGGVGIAALYSPCTAFCEHPPGNCKGSEKFKASCETACHNLQQQSGLSILVQDSKLPAGAPPPQCSDHIDNDANGQTDCQDPACAAYCQGEGTPPPVIPMIPKAVSGTEYVETLKACAFANGQGKTCEKVIETVLPLGLWCEEKK